MMRNGRKDLGFALFDVLLPLSVLFMILFFICLIGTDGKMPWYGWVFGAIALLSGGIDFVIFLTALEETLGNTAREVDKKLKISKRAGTAAKRVGRWLDKKFPAEDDQEES